MATMSSYWRSPTSAAAIFSSWRNHFGPDRAALVAKKLPPRVLRGRFGAIHKVCQFFFKATQPETEKVFCEVFDPELKKYKAEVLVEDADGES